MSMDQALEQIKSKRSKASPNGSFLRQLKVYEEKLTAEWTEYIIYSNYDFCPRL